MTPLAALQCLRLASPGLPIGAYSYSQGLETAIDLGQIHDRASAEHWLRGLLVGPVSRYDAPMLARAHRASAANDAPALVALNQTLLASRDSREQRQESVQMGYSLRQLLAALPETASQPLPAALQDGELAFLLAYGWAGCRLGLDAATVVQAYLWVWLENQVMVLMKALPMGQTAGQQLMSALLPALAAASEQALTLPDARLSAFAPMQSWMALRHETQYSRLFRS